MRLLYNLYPFVLAKFTRRRQNIAELVINSRPHPLNYRAPQKLVAEAFVPEVSQNFKNLTSLLQNGK